MGVWGYKLYQNDLALDVKDNFRELYDKGGDVSDITRKLMENYGSVIGTAEEPLFWYALADTEWNFGVLLPYVKEQALQCIEAGGSVPKCQLNISSKAQWDKTLNTLQTKLSSPQPPSKKPVKKRVYTCQWKVGDVFAYQMESELAKEKGLYGQYLLIQKIDEGVWHPGHIVPIVYVKMTETGKLPVDLAEYDALEYIQTSFSKYEERFWPIDMRRPQEDIAEKSKINYETDEFGYLPKYRITLLNTSKRVIPQKLLYLGNFIEAAPPRPEFVPHSKVNIPAVNWKLYDETFETKMIKCYCNHNLRELGIYSKKSMQQDRNTANITEHGEV